MGKGGRGGQGGRGGKHYTPNDMRSNTKNSNNPACKASMDNRSRQLNPRDNTYWDSRDESKEKKDDQPRH